MPFNDEHKRQMAEIYFKNGRKIDGQWVFSTRDAFGEFVQEFPELAADFHNFSQTALRVVDRIRATGNVGRKEDSGMLRKRDEVNVEIVRQVMKKQPETSIRHLK